MTDFLIYYNAAIAACIVYLNFLEFSASSSEKKERKWSLPVQSFIGLEFYVL